MGCVHILKTHISTTVYDTSQQQSIYSNIFSTCSCFGQHGSIVKQYNTKTKQTTDSTKKCFIQKTSTTCNRNSTETRNKVLMLVKMYVKKQ